MGTWIARRCLKVGANSTGSPHVSRGGQGARVFFAVNYSIFQASKSLDIVSNTCMKGCEVVKP